KKAQDMAKLLNKIIKDFYKSDLKTKSAQLKELLGHTPKEVFVGLILGVLVSLTIHLLLAPE
ncbi:MAG: divergent PAP2 family protein, partial [Alphaproteobacteria bacterium]|nr:divergent PAP2 family protein [Alphaproteobacteria bacterium]